MGFVMPFVPFERIRYDCIRNESGSMNRVNSWGIRVKIGNLLPLASRSSLPAGYSLPSALGRF